ncbi:MAG TPA: shikimate dehydrogenase [Gemmatimonadaceae bacterium]|nr:shikimate dehydrogenase [Gemmatimonadaceae bacterium]
MSPARPREAWPTRLVILGAPVAHSLSPVFQNAALAAAGIPLTYERLHVEPSEFARAFAALTAAGAAGNVTIPHKEAAAAACDRLAPVARRVGAVNTFWREDGETVGDNTDVGGFTVMARELLGGEPASPRIALLGAGGAAAAVLAAATDWTAREIRVHARTPARAEQLAARLGLACTVTTTPEEAVDGADLVVNATPVGLHDETLPVRVDALREDAAVLDLIVRRDETPLVRAARARGLRATGGRPMLLEQGALAFARWFGVEPDRDVMRRALAG